MAESSPLLRLPLELRELIYSYYLAPEPIQGDQAFGEGHLQEDQALGGGTYKFRFELLRVCRSVLYEAQTVWRREHTFVRIESPWREVAEHVSVQGMVPIITIGDNAATFPHATAVVRISAPQHGIYASAENSMVLRIQDLPLFCEVWYYRSLSNLELNSQLTLSLSLRDPYNPRDPKPLSLASQRSMLMPFGAVKKLQRVDFTGGWNEDIIAEVKKKMTEMWPSVQEAVENATSLMEEGDTVLAEAPKQNADAALELYKRAFHAIHILIDGRSRRVEADHFFHDEVLSGRYSGQAAATVRIILRIRLVARTVLAYLHASQPLEAAFWGMRTVSIMRQALDTEFEEFLGDFVGSGDTGLIYARTAIAISMLERDCPANWREDISCEEAPGITSGLLWTLAMKSLGRATKKADMKRALDEAKMFGVDVEPMSS